MSYKLDTQTTDIYQYLECPGSTQVTVQVSNAAVYIGFGVNPHGMPAGGTYDPDDEVLIPTVGGLSRTCDEIRVKNYVAGTPADVKLTAQ